MKLTMLGTGNALVTECYNTCFVIEDKGQYFMVDLQYLAFDRFSRRSRGSRKTGQMKLEEGCVWLSKRSKSRTS